MINASMIIKHGNIGSEASMFPISQDPVGRIRQNNLIRDQTQTPATHTLHRKLNRKVAQSFKMGRDVLLKKYNCIRLETFSPFASEISKVISDRVSMSNIKNRPMALVGKTLRRADAVCAIFHANSANFLQEYAKILCCFIGVKCFFEANFEILLLCYFFSDTLFLCYFYVLF